MADTVTSQTIQDGERKAVLKFTNISDGSGESAVKKVDVSALASNSSGTACTEVAVSKIWWQCVGMGVELLNDATTDTLIIGLSPDSNGMHDYSSFSGIPNDSGSGKTGDIMFTTIGASNGDTYTVILELLKTY
jgi:hypothetical protein|tara:strand:- start:1275 stop:1676 length:402 start_codon:yes stop_codon:yes gene_type:complete